MIAMDVELLGEGGIHECHKSENWKEIEVLTENIWIFSWENIPAYQKDPSLEKLHKNMKNKHTEKKFTSEFGGKLQIAFTTMEWAPIERFSVKNTIQSDK